MPPSKPLPVPTSYHTEPRQAQMPDNLLYYGDNLDILRNHIADDSVDLVYLDPPFNSNASYNVLFAERNGSRAAAQSAAFEDTWLWNQAAAPAYQAAKEASAGTVHGYLLRA